MAHDAMAQRPHSLVRSGAALQSGLQTYVHGRGGTASFRAILVHGGLDGARSFSRVARRLDDADVVAYDRRGYRWSRGAPIRAGLSAQVDDLRDVVGWATDAHGELPLVVVGHSYGGLIALAAAAGPASLADAVVAYEPPFPWLIDHPYADRPALSDDGAVEAERFFRRVVGDHAWQRLDEADREVRRADGPALLEDLRVLRGPKPFEVGAVTVPVSLGLGGATDDRRRVAAAALASLMPVATLDVFDGSGHGAHLSSPDRFAALVGTAASVVTAPQVRRWS